MRKRLDGMGVLTDGSNSGTRRVPRPQDKDSGYGGRIVVGYERRLGVVYASW